MQAQWDKELREILKENFEKREKREWARERAKERQQIHLKRAYEREIGGAVSCWGLLNT